MYIHTYMTYIYTCIYKKYIYIAGDLPRLKGLGFLGSLPHASRGAATSAAVVPGALIYEPQIVGLLIHGHPQKGLQLIEQPYSYHHQISSKMNLQGVFLCLPVSSMVSLEGVLLRGLQGIQGRMSHVGSILGFGVQEILHCPSPSSKRFEVWAPVCMLLVIGDAGGIPN